MSRARFTARSKGAARFESGAENGSLNLIHRNKVPEPVSMRVSGRLGGAEFILVTQTSMSSIPAWLELFAGPVGGLIAWRAAHARTT